MLKIMREKAGSWFIKVLLGAIVLVFVFWGVGTFRSQRLSKVAQVNGEIITMDDYEKIIRQYLNANIKVDNQMRSQILSQLIDEKLILQEAEKLKFRVSDKELAEEIKNDPRFQTNGVFDAKFYTQRVNTEAFEEAKRKNMLIQKIQSFITDSVKISDTETRAWYDWNKAELKVDYVYFDPAIYKDVQPTDEELKAYFDKNKENYKTEMKLKTQYLRFANDTYVPKVQIPEEDIKTYYESNLDDFKEEKSVEARHILFKLKSDNTDEEIEAQKKKAEDVRQMALKGDKTFEDLAKEYSEGPSKSQGGYLGAFKKGRMVKPFEEKAFAMKSGEVSELVRTQFGWHIIKVEKVNEAKTFTLDESREKIQTKLTNEKASELAYSDAKTVFEATFGSQGSLKKVAQARNLNLLKTDFFTQKQGPKEIQDSAEFVSAALNLEPMEISEILELKDGCYLIQVSEKINEKIDTFENVKAKVRQNWIREKQDEKAKADADKFLAAVKSSKNMADKASEYNVTPKTTDFFGRTGSIPELGFKAQISKAAFELSEKQLFPKTPIKAGSGYYIIKFNEKKLPDDKAFEKENASIKERLLRQKQFKSFSEWLAQVRKNSQIVQEDIF